MCNTSATHCNIYYAHKEQTKQQNSKQKQITNKTKQQEKRKIIMKKINTKVTKRIAVIVMAAAAAFSLMGCSVEKNFTTTETHTYTDADGNTTTTTTTNHNGEVTTETTSSNEVDSVEAFENVPIEFDNEMGWDVGSFSIKMSSSDEWSDNYFSEDQYLIDGDVMTGLTVSYDSENRFIDINVADSEGESVEFDDIELPVDGAEKIVVTLCFDDADGSFFATVEP